MICQWWCSYTCCRKGHTSGPTHTPFDCFKLTCLLLQSVTREQNMVRARSKTVDNAIFPAMVASAGLTQRPSQRR